MPTLRENISQTRAIETIQGPLIIVSCPGAGKTTTMVRRIHHMIECGVDPKRILMVTFARSAAMEMKEKYIKIYGVPAAGVMFATFHAICLGIIKSSGMLGSIKVLPEKEQFETIVNAIGYRSTYVDNRYDLAKKIITDISVMKNREVKPDAYMPKSCEKAFFDGVYRAYEEYKHDNGYIDFDDMIIRIRDAFRDDREFLRRYQEQYDYIQCDEYQDTNAIQRDILYMLAGDKANLCVVGDDDQSIYRFRGTDSSIMIDFEKDFKKRGKRCEVVNIETNYRCMQRIVDISDICISFNKKRIPKRPISEKGRRGENGNVEYIQAQNAVQEASRVLRIIKEKHSQGVPYKDIAVLYRKNKQATMPAQALSAEGIPYCANDRLVCVYDEWMFRDIKAYTEMAMGIDVNKNKMRVLNRPSRYLSPNTFRNIPFTAEEMLKGIKDKKNNAEWMYTAAQDSIFAWLNNFGEGKLSPQDSPKKVFSRLTGKGSIHYDKYIKDRAKFNNEDPEEAKAQFDELRKEAMRFSTISDWFEHAGRISMMVSMDSQKKDPNGVWLSTIHAAKGKEWNTVIVIGVNQHNIPGKSPESMDDVEEERRILYVAMTRAVEDLRIISYGKESIFMTQTMPEYREKISPTVKKKLKGSPVMHANYGRGRIDAYTKDRVLVYFDSVGLKKFKFPDAFAKEYLIYL